MNGYSLIYEGTDPFITVTNGSDLIIFDSTWSKPDIVTDNNNLPFEYATSQNGLYTSNTAIYIDNGSSLTVYSGNIISDNSAAIVSGYNDSNNMTTIQIDNGLIMGNGVVSMMGNTASLTINNGYFESTDNPIIDTVLTTNMQGRNLNITVNDGVFIGYGASGDLACGIHKRNAHGALIVNGGYFYIYEGIGILCRAGAASISNLEETEGRTSINNALILTTGLNEGQAVSVGTLSNCVPLYLDATKGWDVYTRGGATCIAVGSVDLERQPESSIIVESAGNDALLKLNGGTYNPKIINTDYIDTGYTLDNQTFEYKSIVSA